MAYIIQSLVNGLVLIKDGSDNFVAISSDDRARELAFVPDLKDACEMALSHIERQDSAPETSLVLFALKNAIASQVQL